MLGPLGPPVRGRPAQPPPAADRRRPGHGRGPDAGRRGPAGRPRGDPPVRGGQRGRGLPLEPAARRGRVRRGDRRRLARPRRLRHRPRARLRGLGRPGVRLRPGTDAGRPGPARGRPQRPARRRQPSGASQAGPAGGQGRRGRRAGLGRRPGGGPSCRSRWSRTWAARWAPAWAAWSWMPRARPSGSAARVRSSPRTSSTGRPAGERPLRDHRRRPVGRAAPRAAPRQPDPGRLGHVRLRHRVRRRRRCPAPRRDLLQGHDAPAADRQPHPAGDRDAGRDAQLDRPAEPRRRRRRSRKYGPTWQRLARPGDRQRRRRVDRGLRRGRPPPRRRARGGRHRAEHLLPERGQGRAPVRDRPGGGRRGHGRRPPGRPTCRCWSSSARTWPTSGRSPGRSRRPAPTRSRAINTLSGIAVGPGRRRPLLGNVYGGLSGPAIKPVALRIVYEVAQVVDIPIIAIGGVAELDDVLDFLAVGAVAVQVGTALFADPALPVRLVDELAAECRRLGLDSYAPLIGTALPKRPSPSSATGVEYRPSSTGHDRRLGPMTTVRRAAEVAARSAIAAGPRRCSGARAPCATGHFLLKSGRHGEHYLEKFQVLQDPAATSELCGILGDGGSEGSTASRRRTSSPGRRPGG